MDKKNERKTSDAQANYNATLQEIFSKYIEEHRDQLFHQLLGRTNREQVVSPDVNSSKDRDLRDIVKSYIAREGKTLQDICDELTKRGKPTSSANLTNKLRRETITFVELVEIADILGYRIEWVPKRPMTQQEILEQY